MTKREQVDRLRRAVDSAFLVTPQMANDIAAAADALAREAEAEEKAKPKVTLRAQEEACHACGEFSARPVGDVCADLLAAADTLRRLREEGPSQMADLRQLGMYRAVAFLRSLGVEPRP